MDVYLVLIWVYKLKQNIINAAINNNNNKKDIILKQIYVFGVHFHELCLL